MAKNPPKGPGCRGAVKDRSQPYNPLNERWYRRDKDTGSIMGGKAAPRPFKGVRKEKQS